jgi:hypothetical protein
MVQKREQELEPVKASDEESARMLEVMSGIQKGALQEKELEHEEDVCHLYLEREVEMCQLILSPVLYCLYLWNRRKILYRLLVQGTGFDIQKPW